MSKNITIDELKKRFHEKHGNKYDYSKVEYKTKKTKVCIICPEHGEFWQTPHNHENGQGCPKCAIEKNRKLQQEKCERAKCTFIERAKKVHGNKYDYSKVEYRGNKTKICIICPTHGEFWQRPNDHLSGHGCYKCNCHNHTKDFDNFLELANKKHKGKYTYDSSSYINRNTKIKIMCPEHGEFWQTPSLHLHGNGCPLCGTKCNVSERKILNSLKENFPNEDIIYQYRDKDLLGLMSFDIYFPKYKIAIEHQGIQHYEPIKRFGGIKKLNETKLRDELKRKICKRNNIDLLYISLYGEVLKYSSSEERIIPSIEELIIEIKRKIRL